jgi:ApaG protein
MMTHSFANSAGRYAETTRDITVSVLPVYLEDQSTPEAGQFVWAYHIRIENHGAETVQLLRRHWRITDSHGHLLEVRGEGVVGEQPVLRPGEAYEYTSGTPLQTPSGIMAGSYRMTTQTGEEFDITIPAFSLDSPYGTPQIH